MNRRKIQKELSSVGANKSEAEMLAKLAGTIGDVKLRGLSADAKKRLAPDTKVATYRHYNRWAIAGSFAVLCLMVVFAQSALPGSWLYGVKRGTEQVRSAVQPSYKDNVVEVRLNEVEQLKQEAAPPEQVEKAEKSYQDALRKFKERHRDQKDEIKHKWRGFRQKDDHNSWDYWRNRNNDESSKSEESSNNR